MKVQIQKQGVHTAGLQIRIRISNLLPRSDALKMDSDPDLNL